jgi:hypothetical protein
VTPRTSTINRAVLLLVALALGGAACRRVAVSEAERELLLRAQDLAPYGFELADAARHESFNKTVYFDGSSDLEYEFAPPDGSLYMVVTVTFARDKNDARMTKGGEKVGLQVGVGLEGVKLEEKHGFFKYGDESSFYALTKDGRPGGLFFNTREGTKVYSVLISGVYFDSAEDWAELITPRLQKFSAHRP